MATKPGERKLQILQVLAEMLQQPQGEKITTAALAAKLSVSEAALYRITSAANVPAGTPSYPMPMCNEMAATLTVRPPPRTFPSRSRVPALFMPHPTRSIIPRIVPWPTKEPVTVVKNFGL